MAPEMLTINDFFHALAGLHETDGIHLLLELYETYRKLMPDAEALDEFISWGRIILSDFNDVDKYLVDPRRIFTNVAQFREMSSPQEYLTPEQYEALNRFTLHFKTSGEIKRRFLKTWDILYPLYAGFNAALEEKGLGYEGMAYRKTATMFLEGSAVDILSKVFPETGRFVFVGLNALNECEKKVLSRMRDAGIAEFCWDYSSEEIRNCLNKSSFFLKHNVEQFPKAFKPDPDGLGRPEVNVLTIPSSAGAAMQLPTILDGMPTDIRTAVVLPDENMLIPVLNSIPSTCAKVNVTMGYPMRNSGFWSLFNGTSTLQLHIRFKNGEAYFYYRQVQAILSNGELRKIMSEEETRKAERIIADQSYYIAATEFKGSELFEAIFSPVVSDPSVASAELTGALEKYELKLLEIMEPELEGMSKTFAGVLKDAVRRLSVHSLEIRPQTYFRLLDSLVGKAAVPFEGEPLEGLQIMGPLETRALDFENVIILNSNEGMFPRHNVSESYIPPELRKGFGLPTYEYQDAVWAYYFYRLIQRAKRVWMVVDSRAEDLHGGEESRYIKQLELHFKFPVRRWDYGCRISTAKTDAPIEKTQEDLKLMRQRPLSATALQNYLYCPAKFYFSFVRKFRKKDEVDESIDAGKVGNIYHKSMELLYRKGGGKLSAKYLGSIGDGDIKQLVRERLMEEMRCFEVRGKNLIYEDIVCRYVRRTVDYDLGLMKENGVPHISIIGLEKGMEMTVEGWKFYGIMDRIDSVVPGCIRIVDYKTGSVKEDEMAVTDDNAEAVVGKLFGEKNKDRPKIALQLYLYDRFCKDIACNGETVVNCIYQTTSLFTSEPLETVVSKRFSELIEPELSRLLKEIGDPDIPFRRCNDPDTCKYCDFKTLCGR